MKKLTRFSVNYPVTVLMMVLAILLLGYISFTRLGIDLFPNLKNPRLFIKLSIGEKPPEEIEKNYTDYLEALAIRQSGVVEVSSISQVGQSQITVEYNWSKDMDEAFLDLQKTISSATQEWDVDELTITQYDPNATPIMTIALSHQTISNMNDMRKTAENYIRNELIRLEGIADVEISGDESREVFITTDNYVLEAHGITLDNLKSQIERFNQNVSGGSIEEMGKQYIIKGVSVYQSLEDFSRTIIGYQNTAGIDTSAEAPVYLRDIADIKFRNADPENIVKINGRRCLGLYIYKETKYNTVKAIEDLQISLESLRKSLPGYEFTVVNNQGKFIQSSIREVQETALIGIILAIVVLFVFLRRIGITSIISIAIPISIVATFNLVYFNDLSLNIMTLGGLALGAGMLVDNAIVVMENIFRNLENGMSPTDAAVNGTAQVGGAITASTITTIIVFLPIVYLQGASGELFKDQAWTVAFSLISSLFVAILVIPVLTSKFIKPKKEKNVIKSVKFKSYSNFLLKTLNNRWYVIAAATLMVGSAVLLIPIVGSEFMPQTKSSEFTVNFKLSEGTDLDRTESTISNIENIISETFDNSLKIIYTQAGPSSGIENSKSSNNKDNNSGFIKLVFNDDLNFTHNSISSKIQNIFSKIPEIEYSLSEGQSPLNEILGTEESPIILEIKGDDLETLELLAESVSQTLMEMPELANVESIFENGAPEIEIEIDRLKAGIHNISVSQISTQIEDLLMGKSAGSWDYEGELNEIKLKLPDVTLRELENIIIRNGKNIFRLNELATITVSEAPKEIYRRNQSRIGKITAQIASDESLDQIVKKIETQISNIEIPSNYRVNITGEEKLRAESMKNLTFAMLLSIVLVYMALASQFESIIHPFTILLTIPLAGVGAVFIFALLGMPFNIMAYIGIIMLTGIAVNDSIILVDAINQLKTDGLSRKDAILRAGERRIRPIIMTSLTTILALFPLTVGIGEGSELRSPMAIAVIGGLITSTLLTLVVIPCVYYVLDVFKEKIKFSS